MTAVVPTTYFNSYSPFGGGWSKTHRLVARNGNVKQPEYVTGLRVIISNAMDATSVQTVQHSGRGYLETLTQHVKFSSINGSYAAEIGSWGSPVTETRLAELIANAKAESNQIDQCELLELANLQWRFPLDGHATLEVDQTHSVSDNNQPPSVANFSGSVSMPFIPHTPTTRYDLFSPAFFIKYGGFYPPNDFSSFAASQTAGIDGLLQIRSETNTFGGNITATGSFDLIKACYLYTTSTYIPPGIRNQGLHAGPSQYAAFLNGAVEGVIFTPCCIDCSREVIGSITFSSPPVNQSSDLGNGYSYSISHGATSFDSKIEIDVE